jgi:hypothetical protein
MSIMRRAAWLGAGLLAGAPLCAQEPHFAPTLFWDAGLINTPAAYVSPLGGDLSLNISRLSLDSAKTPSFQQTASYAFSISASAWERAEFGVTVFGSKLRSGLFAKVVAWQQSDGIWRKGFLHWLPSIAFGVRNIGAENLLNRFGTENIPGLNTAPSLYGVATRTFVLGQGDAGARPASQLSFSAGYGGGLFSHDGGLKTLYAKSATGGAFGGAQLQFATGRFSSLSFMAEHDGWDVNAGAQLEVRGLRASLYLMELGAGQGQPGSAANQKVAFSLGWQTNIEALVRGDRMAARIQKIERDADALRKQIDAGEERVRALDAQLKSILATSASGQAAQIEDLKRQLQEERAAVARLQELLRQREAAKKP